MISPAHAVSALLELLDPRALTKMATTTLRRTQAHAPKDESTTRSHRLSARPRLLPPLPPPSGWLLRQSQDLDAPLGGAAARERDGLLVRPEVPRPPHGQRRALQHERQDRRPPLTPLRHQDRRAQPPDRP